VLAAAAVAVAIAWTLGLPELSVVAAAAAAVVVLGAAQVLVRRVPLEIHRTARPARLQVGTPCEVRLVVTNPGPRASPVLDLADDVGRFGVARLLLAPVRPGASTVATYSLPTERRGLHHVGPLTTTVHDPFGTARRSRVHPTRTSVVVTPRTWPLAPLPPAPGDEPDHGTHALTTASTLDEEFAALRDYVPGDDIRRIHWRSSARRGSPVVRQFDVPWQHRTTIVADLRADRHDDASFERLVSCVASLLELSARRSELVRLVTSEVTPSGFSSAAEVLDEEIDRLAVLAPSSSRVTPGQLVAWLARRSSAGGGRLVTCVGGLLDGEQVALGDAGRSNGVHVVVSTRGGRGGVAIPGARLVEWDGSTGLDERWDPVVGSTSHGVPA
jgi:uncharacterized protein (DUF58 family)